MTEKELYDECHKRFIYNDGELYYKYTVSHKAQKGDKAGYLEPTKGKMRTCIKGERILIHRVIFLMHHGYLPEYPKYQLDHINRDKLDNRIENLRVATNSQNMANKPSCHGKTSIYKGVCKRGDKWYAQIKYNGKVHHIGSFDDEVTAALAYNDKATIHHGEFAYINKIGGE